MPRNLGRLLGRIWPLAFLLSGLLVFWFADREILDRYAAIRVGAISSNCIAGLFTILQGVFNYFSAADYVKQAEECIKQIKTAGDEIMERIPELYQAERRRKELLLPAPGRFYDANYPAQSHTRTPMPLIAPITILSWLRSA